MLAPDAGAPHAADAALQPPDAEASSPDAESAGPDASPAGPDATPGLTFVRAVRDGGEEIVSNVLWGDLYRPLATGLPPSGEVTLRARADVVNQEYEAWAKFKVAADGTVDVGRDAPIAGTWTEADPDGPIWSATRAADGADKLAGNVLEVQVASETATLASARVDRTYLDPRVVKTVVPSEAGVVAELYSLPEAVRRPALIAFGGSEGGISSARYFAYYWASRGTPTLALAYFGAPGTPTRLNFIPLETWDRAYQWLSQRPEVDPDKVAVLGGSRGGEAALAVGASFPWVRGVIAKVPSAVSWPGVSNTSYETPSWTLNGENLPWILSVFAQIAFTTDTDGAQLAHHRVIFEAALQEATPEQVEAATFKVENTKGRILVLAGANDQLWPSCELGKMAWDRLPESHRLQYQDEYWCFADAGHNLPAPGSPTAGTHRALDPYGDGSSYLALGGTPAGTARAARLADERIQALLESL